MMNFEAWLAERNRFLRDLDITSDLVAQAMPGASDEMKLLALHKGRYECTHISDDLRRQSAEWLVERGYGRMTGDPIDLTGELPR